MACQAEDGLGGMRGDRLDWGWVGYGWDVGVDDGNDDQVPMHGKAIADE